MGRRSDPPSRFALSVGGKFAGYIGKVSGGTIRGEVVAQALGTGLYPKKHLASISHEPLTFDVPIGAGGALWDWVRASFDKGLVQVTCELMSLDADMRVKAVRVLEDAHIESVTIPACDASSREPGKVTVRIAPARIRYERGGGDPVSGEEEGAARPAGFRFEIGDLPCDRIARIEAFTWRQKVAADEVGRFREPSPESVSLDCDDLELTLSAADSAPWERWHESFVIEGNCSEAAELTASLVFLRYDSEPLATIGFGHVGIISLEHRALEADAEPRARFTVELYAENLSLDI